MSDEVSVFRVEGTEAEPPRVVQRSPGVVARPASRPTTAKRAIVNGGPVGRMHAALATAVRSDADWQEF
jgi:hypothetical protein